MGVNYNPRTVTTGLAVYLDAANPKSYSGTGTTWTDLVGQDNNGTLVNGTSFDSVTKTFNFNGSSQFVTINSPELPTDNFTIELIVYPTSFANSPVIICPQNAGFDQFIRFNTNGTFYFNLAVAGDLGERSYTSIAACALNTYSYIACVKSGSTVTLYKDGALTTTTSSDTLGSAGWGNTTWVLGQRGNSTFYFAGKIPIIRAYNQGLTASDVLQNFNALRGRYGI